jgi:diacylglycerol kinase (ATP)
MNARKHFLIVNLIAGGGRCKEEFPRVKAELDRRGLDYDLHFTNEPLEAVDVAQMVIEAGFTHVVAMGGDGTVNEVANGLVKVGSSLPLAVIPAGSGNDFVRMMGIPTDPIRAIDLLESGTPRTVDLGYVVGDRYFVNGLGVGIDAQVARDVLKMNPRFRGTAAYLYAALKEVLHFKAFPVTLSGEGFEETYDLLSLGITNGKYAGGGFKLAPEASADDGLIDVAAIEDFPIPERLIRLLQVRGGNHLKLARVHYRQTPSVSIASSARLIAHIDGEVYRLPGEEFTVEAAPKALHVMTP